MSQQENTQTLNNISTLWSVIGTAHNGPPEEAEPAQLKLLQRYYGAVRRYLVGALHDAEAAEELAQEFAVRFIRGDFQGVDPRRGRFRDYLRTVLINMVTDYNKRRRDLPVPMSDGIADLATITPKGSDPEQDFLNSWRRELMDRAWKGLEETQQETGLPYHTALRLRLDHSPEELSSGEIAERLSSQFGKRFSADGIRKMLQRARERFAKLILDDVAESLQDSTLEQLQQELRALGLLSYCRLALERRFQVGVS